MPHVSQKTRQPIDYGDTDADAKLATEKARQLDPTAVAVRVEKPETTPVIIDVNSPPWRPEDKCQIRITDLEWDADGTAVEYQGIAASGRTFGDALVKFGNWYFERQAKEEEGKARQQKLRDAGLA